MPYSSDHEKRVQFETVALPFMQALYNTALRLTSDEQDAADILQDTYFRAYRTFDNFRPGTNCKAWLFTILYSVFVNRWKKARREVGPLPVEELEERFRLSVESAAGEGGDAGDVEAWGLRWPREVEAALRALPETFRSAVLLVRRPGAVVRGGRGRARMPGRHGSVPSVPRPPPALRRAGGVCPAHGSLEADETMMDVPPHPADELQLLLDGRLPPERRAAIEEHLARCPRCRRELDAVRRAKIAVWEGLPQLAVPQDVVRRVSAALSTEREAPGTGRDQAARNRRRLAVLGFSLAAAAALVLVLVRPGRPDFVVAAARDLAGYRGASLSLEVRTTEPRALERAFAEGGIRFTTRVFDFGMMGYRLVGGSIHRLAGRSSALFAYEGVDGGRVVCQMYGGALSELPPGAEEREHNGIRFRIYRTGDITLVFWQEGAVVCVLASDGNAEGTIQLAYAKAIKV